MSTHGEPGRRGDWRERYLARYPSQFFLAVQHAVEFGHASRARPRHRQRPIGTLLVRACTRTRTCRLCKVLCVLTLVRYALLLLRSSLLRQIIIHVCATSAYS